MDREWIFQQNTRRTTFRKLGFSEEFCTEMEHRADHIASEAGGRVRFLETAHRYLDFGEIPDDAPADSPWRTLLVLAGYSRMVGEHRKRGIPEAVTQATIGDLVRWAEGGGSTGRGPNLVPLAWTLKPIRNHLLEIGRLQFLPGSFAYPYRIFVHRHHPERVVALAEPGLLCSREGWPVESGADFETTLRDGGGEVRGHAVDPHWGRIERETRGLRNDDWKLAVKQGNGVLDVHIPSGSPLREADSRASFQEAEQLFEKSFPEFVWTAFVCTSWLLDRELSRCLPPHSGILVFGRMFRPLAAGPGGCRQLIERVLDGHEDWQTMPARTSLQKAVVAHLRSGGTFRTTSGVRLRARWGGDRSSHP